MAFLRTALFLGIAFLSLNASAKRAAAPRVTPIIVDGLRVEAPNDDGWSEYIQARDEKTEETLWKLRIFKNPRVKRLEQEAQWVFIKSLTLDQGDLIVVDERYRAFRVDLQHRVVKRLKEPPPISPPKDLAGACLPVLLGGCNMGCVRFPLEPKVSLPSTTRVSVCGYNFEIHFSTQSDGSKFPFLVPQAPEGKKYQGPRCCDRKPDGYTCMSHCLEECGIRNLKVERFYR